MTAGSRNVISVGFLALLSLIVLGAPFIAPYPASEQFRQYPHHPPHLPRFVDGQGHWSFQPFVLESLPSPTRHEVYVEGGRKYWVTAFVPGAEYELLGFTFETHLFGLDDSSRPIFLLGTDTLGRDLLSRTLLGARFSILVGLAAVFLTSFLGLLLGTAAGYREGLTDRFIMRTADLFLSLPGLFLVLGIRAVFPLEISPQRLFWLTVMIFGLAGWGVVARVIRGQVLSLKMKDYVNASRVAGATEWRIIKRHIWPGCRNYLVVQGTMFLPAFILGEITLSFLGVGVQEPNVSWGTLLVEANSVRAITAYPWLLAPALLIFATVLVFNIAGERMKALGRQRPTWW